MSPDHRRLAGTLCLLVALSGCGTTVAGAGAQQLASTTDNGLGVPLAPTGGTTSGGTSSSGSASSGSSQVAAGAPAAPGQAATRGPGGTAGVGGAAPAPALSTTGERVRTPISVGILAQGSANAAAAALGANYSTSTTGADVARALVRYYNKHGGISGRQIKPVEYIVDVASGSYESEYEAACARFTQDNDVAVAISILANAYYDNYESCLAKAGVPDITGPTGGTDDHDLAQYPSLISATAPSTNRRFEALMSRFRGDGFLSARSKVGIIVEGCPYNLRAYKTTIEPLAKRYGWSVERRDVDCLRGFSEAGQFINQVGSAVVPFRTAEVDRVMFVSNFEGVALLGFENAAHSQGYAPSYALTSTTGGAALAGQFQNDQLKRMRGVGWTPDLDIAARALPSAATKRCRAMLASEGIQPQSKADDLLDLVCDQFFVLEAALTKSGGQAERGALAAAFDALGSSHVSPYLIEGASSYRGGKHFGPRLYATWGYQAGCGCMAYLTRPAPLE